MLKLSHWVQQNESVIIMQVFSNCPRCSVILQLQSVPFIVTSPLRLPTPNPNLKTGKWSFEDRKTKPLNKAKINEWIYPLNLFQFLFQQHIHSKCNQMASIRSGLSCANRPAKAEMASLKQTHSEYDYNFVMFIVLI